MRMPIDFELQVSNMPNIFTCLCFHIWGLLCLCLCCFVRACICVSWSVLARRRTT